MKRIHQLQCWLSQSGEEPIELLPGQLELPGKRWLCIYLTNGFIPKTWFNPRTFSWERQFLLSDLMLTLAVPVAGELAVEWLVLAAFYPLSVALAEQKPVQPQRRA